MWEWDSLDLAMTKIIVLALLSAALALPIVAHASTGACLSKGAPALGEIEISPTNDAASTFYVDDRNFAMGNGIWMYQESNGIFTGGHVAMDLQRGGSSPYVPDDNEVCTDNKDVAPDVLIE